MANDAEDGLHTVRKPDMTHPDSLVITWMLTSHVDPQRDKQWDFDPTQLTVLESLGVLNYVVCYDDPLAEVPDERWMFVETNISNPYFARWHHVNTILNTVQPDQVFCVDGTDVTMLRDPFPEMIDDVLYIGSETLKVGHKWMRNNHPDTFPKLSKHLDRNIINPGLVGGDSRTVGEFARLVKLCWQGNDQTDVAAVNHVVYDRFNGRFITGDQVHTVFKEYRENGVSWWMHK